MGYLGPESAYTVLPKNATQQTADVLEMTHVRRLVNSLAVIPFRSVLSPWFGALQSFATID